MSNPTYWHHKCHRCIHLDESEGGPDCKRFGRSLLIDHHWTQEPVRLEVCIETGAKEELTK